MKNILSYKSGTLFSGKEIKDWIKYHTENETSKTKVAKKMKKYLNIEDNEQYFLYKDTYSSSETYNEYLIAHSSKRRNYHGKND